MQNFCIMATLKNTHLKYAATPVTMSEFSAKPSEAPFHLDHIWVLCLLASSQNLI